MLPDALHKDDPHQDPMFLNPFSRLSFQSVQAACEAVATPHS